MKIKDLVNSQISAITESRVAEARRDLEARLEERLEVKRKAIEEEMAGKAKLCLEGYGFGNSEAHGASKVDPKKDILEKLEYPMTGKNSNAAVDSYFNFSNGLGYLVGLIERRFTTILNNIDPYLTILGVLYFKSNNREYYGFVVDKIKATKIDLTTLTKRQEANYNVLLRYIDQTAPSASQPNPPPK